MLIFFVWNFSLFSGIDVVPDGTPRHGEPALVLALLAICVMALSGLYHNKAFADFRVMAIQIAIAFVALLGIVSVYELYFRELLIISPDPPGALQKQRYRHGWYASSLPG